MACVLSRVSRNFRFSFSLKKFSSQAVTKSDVSHSKVETDKLSTLFVPGRHGADMYQIVKPLYDIDYISCNLDNLKLSCDLRGISVDFDYLLPVAKEWLNLRDKYTNIVKQDQEYVSEIHRLSFSNMKKEIETLENKRNELRDTLLAAKCKLHDIEDIFMPLFQKIPHILHPNTPSEFCVIDVCREPKILDKDLKSHAEIAEYRSELHFINNSSISYFLTGKLSQLELAIQAYFMSKLSNHGFSPFSCTDFCKSFIIEAIGYDPYSNLDSIQIQGKNKRDVGQKLNLVGGASFESFCAYFANMNIDRLTLPFKYFSMGRRYNAANKISNSRDLFSVVQCTNLHGLIISESSAANTFDVLLNAVIMCYTELNIPFRMVTVPAKKLTVAESYRKLIELWSPALKDYVPVAYVSQHDDFVSKRLQISYGFLYHNEGYCNIVEGTIVNIPILIGCLIENLQTKDGDFNIPTALESYFSSFSE